MRILSLGLMALLALPALSACENGGTDPEDREPERVEVAGGNARQGTVGQALAQPVSGAVGGPARGSLAVRVLDALGNPVPGVDVGWTTTGGGTSPARTQWTLGPRTDLVQGVTATVPGLNAITFTGRSASRVRSTVSSPIASFTPGAVIPVTVDLAGDAGGPVQGVRVSWTVVSGGGTVSPASSITSGGGEAQAQWSYPRSGKTVSF